MAKKEKDIVDKAENAKSLSFLNGKTLLAATKYTESIRFYFLTAANKGGHVIALKNAAGNWDKLVNGNYRGNPSGQPISPPDRAKLDTFYT